MHIIERLRENISFISPFSWLLGWTLPPRHALIKMLKEKLTPPETLDNFVCQDFGIKIDDLGPLMDLVDKETKVYPLWLCPTRHVVPEGLDHLSFFKKEDLHIDLGVYG